MVYDKIEGTNLDEQYAAFALIDWENFIELAYINNLITIEEYQNMKNNVNKIAQRCGLQGGE